ncbi:NAD(P)/FAD-dependent oxidoreductase [Phyllobacterium sophorae]|uniref:Pyridine nucleotide-disulfide oxidoreductase n=1 Tax=Phyllobacterium sophorae TaxID=1520277 RepID=A0A2P7B2W1_9HYPH|nr:FAD-dependent oxidoreductase [Phyllobacterium sophorae]PSH60807.1 pyridine nucleotide-disulfide oxidoreductase [Phyllobacterium sophorae]
MSNNPIDQGARIVVIGAGQAGFTACAKLRELGHPGPITLIGEEAHPPYQRPPLSKGYLLGEMTEDRLYFRPINFYQERSIDLRLSERVGFIDRVSKVVGLSNGSTVPYDRLILTTGARPRSLPAEIGGDLEGVFYVRNLADINSMAHHFRPGQHVLIVGGGYVGLEAAAVSAKLGLEVTLIEASQRILQRVACPQTSAYFRNLHGKEGVVLCEDTGLKRLSGEDGHVRSAELADNSVLPIDFVIVGIGVVPNVELAEAAGLTIDNGIAVDEDCRTSDPDIYAAGDCASFPWRSRRIRLESVGNAIEQAESVAKALMGQSSGYEAKPWFWSDQFDVKLQIAGYSQGYDNVATRKSVGDGVSYWYYRGGDLLAVDAMNDPRVYMVAKRLIEAGTSPDPTVVSDPATDVKSLLP